MGNPQNMLIGQFGRLHFGHFMLWCAPPTILSLVGAFLIIKIRYCKSLSAEQSFNIAASPEWPDFDRRQSSKGIFATLLLLAAFFTPIPREDKRHRYCWAFALQQKHSHPCDTGACRLASNHALLRSFYPNKRNRNSESPG